MKRTTFSTAWPRYMGISTGLIVACLGAGIAHGESPVANPTAMASKVDVGATRSGEMVAAEWGSPASNEHLDDIRGGFDAGSGLLISFGIDRAVYVNGNLVTSTSLYIPNISQMSAEQASALATVANTVNVFQIGPGNTFAPTSLAHATAATVIQNSLNNQNIQTLTTLNTAVNTLNEFRGINLQENLQSALVNSLGH